MSKFTDELKKKHIKQEEQRVGDIYDECVNRGCPVQFANAFNTRAELLPKKQTLAFLEKKDVFKEQLKWWGIYIKILIDNRPDNEKINEWKQCIDLIEKEGVQ